MYIMFPRKDKSILALIIDFRSTFSLLKFSLTWSNSKKKRGYIQNHS